MRCSLSCSRWLPALVWLLASSRALAADYYVDDTASAGGDGSQASPWRAVADIQGIVPGDQVLFRRGGSWDETLHPTSGTSGSPVTYGAFGSGALPHVRSFFADAASYVNVQDMAFRNDDSASAVQLLDCDHIGFERCEMIHSGTAWAGVSVVGSSHNRFLDCVVENTTTTRQNDTMDVQLGSSHNLIEGCTISNGTHSSLALAGAADGTHYDDVQQFNVVRHNTIVSAEGRPLEIMTLSHFTLVEGNTIVGGQDTTSTTGFCRGGQNFKLVTSGNIVRFNLMRGSSPGSVAGLGMNAYQYADYPPNQANDNHIYHNTLVELHGAPVSLRTSLPGVCHVERNVFVNNVVADCPVGRVVWVENEFDGVADNRFRSNLLHAASASEVLEIGNGLYDVAGAESSFPDQFADNLQTDPNLDSSYWPTGAPLVDAAAPLTFVTSPTGSGTSFDVEDAGYFSDGWGVVDGDEVVVGGTHATLTQVDGNTMTVADEISWTQGDGVTLRFHDAAPDIGAFEIGSGGDGGAGGAGGGDGGATAAGGAAGQGGTQVPPASAGSPAEDDGCGCRTGSSPTHRGLWLLPLAASLWLRRRRADDAPSRARPCGGLHVAYGTHVNRVRKPRGGWS